MLTRTRNNPSDHEAMIAYVRDAMVTEVARNFKSSDGVDMHRLADVAIGAMIEWALQHPLELN